LPFSWAKGKSFPALNPAKQPVPEKKKEGKKVYFFEGCLASLFFPGIRDSVFASLSQLGYQVISPEDRVCCGAPSLHLGHEKDVKKLAQQNLESFARENPDYILTICPTGNALLKKTYPRLIPDAEVWVEKIYDFTEFVVTKGLVPDVLSAQKKKEIFYHYPCHYVNELGLREEPLKLLESIGYKPVVEDEPFACCGFSGIFSFKNPELSAHLWQKKGKKIQNQGITAIATDCPGCLFQLKASLGKETGLYDVFHTAELFARQLMAEKSSNLHTAHK
jgi:Fe-S oxidoreductase